MTLELDRLDVPFGSGPGLSDVSLHVTAGERVVIVGASGAGKTSLLRAIAGLAPALGGTVRIGGISAASLPPERRDAVYLQQSPLLFPHMTVAENVAFPLRVRGVAEGERSRRTAEVLGAVRLEGFGRRLPHTLSGGQRHRVALARAVVARPRVLLLDEPLTGLDPSLRDEVRDALLALHRQYGPALLVVTHDLDEAAAIADRIGVLIDRRLAQVAAPAELLTFPASIAVARFLGGFLEVPGSYEGGRFRCALGIFSVGRAPERDGAATAVMRADAVTLFAGGGVGPAAGELPARVEAVRALSRRMQVAVTLGDTRLDVPVPAGSMPRVGDVVRVSVATDLVSVFSDP